MWYKERMFLRYFFGSGVKRAIFLVKMSSYFVWRTKEFCFLKQFCFKVPNDSFVQKAMTNRNENVRCSKCTFNLLNCHRCADIKSFVLLPLQVKQKKNFVSKVFFSSKLLLSFHLYLCVSRIQHTKENKSSDSSSRRSVI